MTDVADGTYFFMHIMKTAGTSFAQHINTNFEPDEIYPHPSTKGPRHMDLYWKVENLRAVDDEERARVRVYAGHFPYAAHEIVGADHVLTILRHPVDRTYSALRHLERHFDQHRGKALEEIYEDSWHHPTWLLNYQVKQFAVTAQDDMRGHTDVIEITDDRYKQACAHLEAVSLVGLTETYDRFTDEVAARFGWEFRSRTRMQVGGDGGETPDWVRRRVEQDSPADLEFYEFARGLTSGR